MRVLALGLLSVAACFSPTAPAGAPCDPAIANSCPQGQVCTSEPGGDFCRRDGEGSAVDATNDGPPSDGPPVETDTAPDGDPQTHFEYQAQVAECVDPGAPDPAKCRTDNGGGGMQMVIDIDDSSKGHPWHAYIRFTPDAAFAGKTITSIKLRVTATNDPNADAPTTGDLYSVQPFTLADLTGTAPAQVMMLAGTQGAVTDLDVIDFPVPVTAVTAGSPAHFGIFPTGGSGVNYWNTSGPNPPVLIIDTE